MKTNLKKEGWRMSAYDSNAIINGNKKVTFTTYGAQDNYGDKIFTQSMSKLSKWIAKK